MVGKKESCFAPKTKLEQRMRMTTDVADSF